MAQRLKSKLPSKIFVMLTAAIKGYQCLKTSDSCRVATSARDGIACGHHGKHRHSSKGLNKAAYMSLIFTVSSYCDQMCSVDDP